MGLELGSGLRLKRKGRGLRLKRVEVEKEVCRGGQCPDLKECRLPVWGSSRRPRDSSDCRRIWSTSLKRVTKGVELVSWWWGVRGLGSEVGWKGFRVGS